jgi:outer membrane protein assembly factor BamB
LEARTGLKRWKYTTGYDVVSSPAVANGVVYVGSWDGKLYALQARTGSDLWSYKIGSTISSSPVVVNGMVYVCSDGGDVYAFGLK